MDNNPFRNHQNTQPNINNTGYTSQAPPPVSNFGYSSPQTGNGYPQQQQQQSWQNNQNTPYSSGQSMNYTPHQTTPIQNSPLQTTPYSTQSAYTPPYQQPSPYNTSLMSSNTPTSGVLGNTYPPYQNSMPTSTMGYQQPYQQQQQQSPYQQPSYQQSSYQQPMFGMNGQPQYGMGMNQPANNFYIPDNFGQSNNNTISHTPKHAPVDATSLLKGTQIRRVECPVCQKMIEGDDMAVNHHVNEHYS